MSCVDFLLETWNLAVSRCGRATTAKNDTKKRDARAKFVFAFLNVLSFVLVVITKSLIQGSRNAGGQFYSLFQNREKYSRSNILQTQDVYLKEIGLLPLKKDDYSFFIGANQWKQLTEEGSIQWCV